MKLILADTADTKLGKKRLSDANKVAFNIRVNVQTPSTGCDADDNDAEEAKMTMDLISGITENGKLSFINIVLYPQQSGPDEYKIMLNSFKTEEGTSLWRNLWNRFNSDSDAVMISLEMQHSLRADEQGNRNDYRLCISAKGLLCLLEDKKISQLILAYRNKFDWTGISRNSSLHVKVTAHIPDDLLNHVNWARRVNKKILEGGASSDVIIETGDGVEIKTHKCFLVSTSFVFERMFESGMEESKSGRIDMTDISEEGVRAFLRFIYHGDMIGPEENLDLAYNLLYAAHKYDVPKLEASMINYLVERKDEDYSLNLAFKVYTLVRGVESASELKAKVVRLMSLKYDELNDLPEFQEVFRKNPSDALEICGNLVKVRPPPPPKRKLDSEGNNPEKRARSKIDLMGEYAALIISKALEYR